MFVRDNSVRIEHGIHVQQQLFEATLRLATRHVRNDSPRERLVEEYRNGQFEHQLAAETPVVDVIAITERSSVP